MEYTVSHFIEKFEAIPEENWMTRDFTNGTQSCANGHCGGYIEDENPNEMIKALIKVFKPLKVNYGGIFGFCINDGKLFSIKAAAINDGDTVEYQQPTPKQRILAALYDIKAMQAVKEAETIINNPQAVAQ